MTLWLALNDDFHCFIIDWFIELHRNSIELTYERNVNDTYATYNLGILRNGNLGCTFIPSSSFSSIVVDDG